MARHIHARSDETHTLTAQARAMPGKRRKAVCVHDPVERYVLLVAVPERVAHRSRCARPAGELADEPVGRDAAWRDAPHEFVESPPPRIWGL
jgi:hypothetical protein